MSEAEYLDSIYPYTEEYYKQLSELHLKSLQKHLKEMYSLAEQTKVGDLMKCPYCEYQIKKKSYQHKFCCTKHKNKYWNIINPRGIMKGEIQ